VNYNKSIIFVLIINAECSVGLLPNDSAQNVTLTRVRLPLGPLKDYYIANGPKLGYFETWLEGRKKK